MLVHNSTTILGIGQVSGKEKARSIFSFYHFFSILRNRLLVRMVGNGYVSSFSGHEDCNCPPNSRTRELCISAA